MRTYNLNRKYIKDFQQKADRNDGSINPKIKGGHIAVFPKNLVKKCIQLSGLEKGILFDCFAGTGTSLIAAKEMGLDYFGCDIDKQYVEFANKRLNTT